jgi:HK97 family phage major capsid protein
VNELYAQPKVSQKMLDDSFIDVEAWIAEKVSEKFGRDEATAFVSGNGVMKPKGLLSYTAGTDITQAQVQQIGSGTSGAFTYAGLVNLQASLKEPYQNNAVFLIQRASNYNLLTIVDGQSRPIFNLSYDKNAGLEPTILGKPVRFAADIPAVGANALAAIYGDVRKAYQIVDRNGIRVLRDPFTAKPHIYFYTTKRTGGAVVNFEAYVIQKLQ